MDLNEGNNIKMNFDENNNIKKGNNLLKLISVIVATAIVFVLGVFSGIYFNGNNGSDYKLSQIEELINKKYYQDIDEDILKEGTYNGIVSALKDPYSVYMNKKQYKEFQESSEGAYVGIGVQVAPQDGVIKIISVFEGSPAGEAGILSGDVIVNVEGTDYTGEELESAISNIRGEEGTDVTFSVRRDTVTKEYTLTRKKVIMDTVKGEMLEDNIGYIRVSEFDEHTGEEFNAMLKDLKEKGMKGVILDLRGNPGGLLNVCVDISSNFIEKGKPVLIIKTKDGKQVAESSKGGDFIGFPVTIIVDGGSASASEVFTGAMKDYNAANIVGEKTFGKGIIQTIFSVGDGSAVKLTTASYVTPKETDIHGVGIEPDTSVIYPEDLKNKTYDRVVDPQFNKALELIKDKTK